MNGDSISTLTNLCRNCYAIPPTFGFSSEIPKRTLSDFKGVELVISIGIGVTVSVIIGWNALTG